MERAGAGRRLGAAILDGLFLVILTGISIVVFAVAGGTRLALQAQSALGVPVNMSTLASEELWDKYEARAEETVREIERRYSNEFSEEQAQELADAVGHAMEQYFLPEQFSVQYFLELDADQLDRMIDSAFDAAVASGVKDVDPATLESMRSDVKMIVDDFQLGTLIPAAISFAVWLALLPLLVTLAYGLVEGLWGRSLGKLISGLTICKADGERAYSGPLLLRYALKYSPLLLLILALVTRIPFLLGAGAVAVGVVFIGALVMLGPERRAIYDYLAGTAVYHGRRSDW